jgi:hypothetical protein
MHGQPKYWLTFPSPTPYQFIGVRLNWGSERQCGSQIIGSNPNSIQDLGQRQLFG